MNMNQVVKMMIIVFVELRIVLGKVEEMCILLEVDVVFDQLIEFDCELEEYCRVVDSGNFVLLFGEMVRLRGKCYGDDIVRLRVKGYEYLMIVVCVYIVYLLIGLYVK